MRLSWESTGVLHPLFRQAAVQDPLLLSEESVLQEPGPVHDLGVGVQVVVFLGEKRLRGLSAQALQP